MANETSKPSVQTVQSGSMARRLNIQDDYYFDIVGIQANQFTISLLLGRLLPVEIGGGVSQAAELQRSISMSQATAEALYTTLGQTLDVLRTELSRRAEAQTEAQAQADPQAH